MNSIYGLIEIGLNRYLALEPTVIAECARLEGRVLAFELTDWNIAFYLAPDNAGVRVLDSWPESPDVRLSGRLAAFIRLLSAGAERQAELSAGRIRVDGDAALADRFTRLLESVELDLEEVLAPVTGDLAAHRLGQLGHGFFGWGRYTIGTLARDVAEYLREESGDLVHHSDVESWMNDVDELAEGVDRLDARMARLEKSRGDIKR